MLLIQHNVLSILRMLTGFVLNESGQVRSQAGLPLAWVAGLLAGAGAILGSPSELQANTVCSSEPVKDFETRARIV